MNLNIQPVEKPDRRADGTVDLHSIFYTIQGEGPFTGHPAVFVRLAGCNLQCPGCDTEYTNGRRRVTPQEILKDPAFANLQHRRRPLVVITGGEPFRQNLFGLVTYLLSRRYEVQIETNGVYGIGELSTLRRSISVVVSPKTNRIHADWEHATAFKYVLTADVLDPEDMLPLRALGHKATPRVARPPLGYRGPIYVNPMDEKDPQRNAANLRAVAEASLRHGYIAGMQLHKLLELE